MTSITYNNVTLQDVLTRNIETSIVREPTDTDAIYLKIKVTADTVVVTNDGSLGITLGTADLGTATKALLLLMNAPRKRFIMRVGNVKLFDILPIAGPPGTQFGTPGEGGWLDIKNGPEASLTIHEIISDYSMRVTFSVTCHVPISGELIDSTSGVLSLKWWQTDSYDENFFVTRKTVGRLNVASAYVSVHALRNFVLPPLQGGFKRTNIDLAEDPSGLILDFTITDRQEYAAPPWPATKWSGRFTVSQPFLGETMGHAECRVSLEGPPEVSRAALVTLAARILFQRLKLTNMGSKDSSMTEGAVVESLVFSEALERNQVDAVGRVRIIADNSKRVFFQNIVETEMGKHLKPEVALDGGYDPTRFQKRFGQLAGLSGLFLDALQEPGNTNIYRLANQEEFSISGSVPSEEEPKEGTAVTAVTAEAIEAVEDDASDEHRKAPYLKASMKSTLFSNSGTIRVPRGVGSTEPISLTEDNTKKIKLHRGQTYRKIIVEMTRVGEAPQIPDPKDSFTDEALGVTHTLVHTDFSIDASGTLSDGRTAVNKVKMYLVYALSKTPDLSKGVPYGKLPYRGSTQGLEKISVLFEDGLVT
jgi:hypothetical protein